MKLEFGFEKELRSIDNGELIQYVLRFRCLKSMLLFLCVYAIPRTAHANHLSLSFSVNVFGPSGVKRNEHHGNAVYTACIHTCTRIPMLPEVRMHEGSIRLLACSRNARQLVTSEHI
jgi:hypothetical protein